MGTSILRAVLFVAVAASTAIAVEAGKLDAWVLVAGHDHQHMSGSTEDLEHALGVAGGAPVLWVRHGGQEWVVRDAKLVARAKGILAPLDELGQKMQPLGEKQGALGKQQGVMGEKMRDLSGDAEHNAHAMEELGRKMEALGKQQEAIGKQQEAIGKRMEVAAREAGVKLYALVDEARAAGLAQPVK